MRGFTERDFEAIRLSGLFDGNWYLEKYPDVKALGIDPVVHYLWLGARLNRNPSPTFDGAAYLAAHPDVAAARLNPLLHYVCYGRAEGRLLRKATQFDQDLTTAKPTLVHQTRTGAPFSLEIRKVLDRTNGPQISDPASAAVEHAFRQLGGSVGTPRISVVMPTWNRSGTVVAALRSALGQSLPPYEIIVSDDGSTDDTLDVIRSAFPEHVANGQIKILSNAHSGVSATRNAALHAAEGDLIAYLDSDNTWRPHFLLLMASAFEESDEIDIGYAGLFQENIDTGHTLIRGRDFDRAQLLRGNFIDLNVVVHKRKLFQQLGGFRLDIKRLVDWDLIVRYTRNYFPFYLPFIGVDYKLSANLNNITNTQPLEENYNKIALAHRPERIAHGVETLKLAYFVYDFPALSQTFVIAEIRELLSQGYDLKVYYNFVPEIVADLDFAVEAYHVADADEFAKLLKAHERNICHSHFAYPGVTNFVRPACNASGVYYTFMPHAVDIFHEANRIRSKVGELGSDPLCLKVMVYGDHHREFLESQGVPRSKIAYTFQAVDLSAFETMRAKRSLDNKTRTKFKIAAIGRFIEKKGFSDLIRALSISRQPDVDLDLYGYGPLEGELRTLVETLRLDNVHFRGLVSGPEALAEIYANADLLAAPSVVAGNGDMDGFPTVILEAMVSEVPVLTTSVSAIPDYVRDGVEAIIVPPRNPQAISDAILAFRKWPEPRRLAMLSRARTLAERTVGVKRTVQRLLDVWLGYKVDLVLVTFNSGIYDSKQETLEIIRRIFDYTTTEFRLAIVDNNSDEEFWSEIVSSVSGKQNVQLIRKKKNVFCGPASNIAIAHGDAEFIIYLCSNEGFIKEHGWERVLIDRMREMPHVGISGHISYLPRYIYGTELIQHPAFHCFRNKEYASAHPFKIFGHVQGGAKIIRRTMFEAAGGYNNETPQANMDVELSYVFESLGYELSQLEEVASITKKTLPGLEALLDEKTVVAHPLDVETVGPRLDALKRPNIAFCNLCGSQFSSFKATDAGREDAECPTCGSMSVERLLYRALANAHYIHRGGRMAILGRSKALRAKVSERMFSSVVASEDPIEFFQRLATSGPQMCVVVDIDFLSGDDRQLEVLARSIEPGGELILVEPHMLENNSRLESDRIEESLASHHLLVEVSFFDVASRRLAFDYRRLRRLKVPYSSETVA